MIVFSKIKNSNLKHLSVSQFNLFFKDIPKSEIAFLCYCNKTFPREFCPKNWTYNNKQDQAMYFDTAEKFKYNLFLISHGYIINYPSAFINGLISILALSKIKIKIKSHPKSNKEINKKSNKQNNKEIKFVTAIQPIPEKNKIKKIINKDLTLDIHNTNNRYTISKEQAVHLLKLVNTEDLNWGELADVPFLHDLEKLTKEYKNTNIQFRKTI